MLFKVLLCVWLCYVGTNGQSAKCFEEAPLVECAGNTPKFFFDSSKQVCMSFKASRCSKYRNSNFFESFQQCQRECGEDSAEVVDNHFGREENFQNDCSKTRICYCPYGLKAEVAKTSVCLPCSCNDQAPVPGCDLACSSGYATNSRGRKLCKCLKTNNDCIVCRNPCRYGYTDNGVGCPTCQCYKPPNSLSVPSTGQIFKKITCSSVCKCQFGVRYEVSNTCFPCQCKERSPVPGCKLSCPAGYAKNAHGRKVCRCLKEVNKCAECEIKCSYGNVPDGRGCYTCNCLQPAGQQFGN